MSNWTHAMCIACWAQAMPGRDPVRLKEPHMERCCFCGLLTKDGIYVRWDPRDLPGCTHGDAPEHTHFTRDIKMEPGQCPACDKYRQSQGKSGEEA